ncbi:Integrase [Mycolicibacterium fortuitum]|uniref:Integrase n=1 Tax=Mycolicibacterium fortuitum TaxID=1766 RepID=A0A0N9Y5N7_MYCFO|nr:Integrase [Mycolicibacterium fortuitum]
MARWYSADGRAHSRRGFKTKKAAEAYETEANYRKQHGVVFDPRRGAITFRDTARVWLDSRQGDLKPSTFDGYRYALADTAKRRGDMRHLGIDAVFGGYPVNAITREDIQAWVQRMLDAGKKPSTVRHAFWIVRMVLEQAVIDNRLPSNPADYVKLPTDHSVNGGKPGVVDDPSQFLTPTQVAALVDALPWPYNVYAHVAAWSGLRAGELCGLQVGDIDLPDPNSATRLGAVRVERTVRMIGGELRHLTPKTKGSRRKVPLTAETTALLRDYLREHPRRVEPDAPLFPNMNLTVPRPTGVKAETKPIGAGGAKQSAQDRQAAALAKLTVADAEARLVLDWAESLRHGVFYKAVYRPAVLRANRLAGYAVLPPALGFHALRHTYASLCVAAGIPTVKVSRFMGHAKPSTTESIYMHLFAEDHADEMDALGAMAPAKPAAAANNVVPLHRGG